MGMGEDIKMRQSAKMLLDVDIPDNSWKPDFDVADRYQSFANELMRIALLGIGGYGFLIKEVWMKEASLHYMMSKFANYIWIGAGALGISLSFVLAHRFFSTSCLYYQVLIMRSLKRLENPHWTEEEKAAEKHFLKKARKTQRMESNASSIVLVLAAIFFALGFLFVIFVFYHCLQSFGT